MNYGESSFKITASLFDKYKNAITSIPKDANITGQLSGYNMDLINSKVSIVLNYTKIQIGVE